MKTARILVLVVAIFSLALLVACGGGGGGSSPAPVPQPQTLTITTTSLPGTLQGRAYSATVVAAGGQGALHWSLSGLDQFHPLFLPGLSIDAGTGVISGTPTFLGSQGFVVNVTDSSSTPQKANASFAIQVAQPLAVSPTQGVTVSEFESSFVAINFSGGIYPITYSFDRNCLPPGLKGGNGTILNGTQIISGTPFLAGTFQCQVTVQDSFSPPEVGTGLMTIVVRPPSLQAQPSLPAKLPLNRPFSGRVIAVGGTPPYSFALTSGSLPPGLGPIDANTGQLSGTPTAAGSYNFTVRVTDSSPTPQAATWAFVLNVSQPLGRNDSPATATAIGNGTLTASISTYIDPPNGTPAPGDNDYYKLVSLGGATVHIETQAKRLNSKNPLDTVIEIVDGNGHQFSTCRQPGDTTTNFNSPCINDDISLTPTHVQDSALDLQVPGASNVATTFYVHVLDWRGDARPDMAYTLNVSGIPVQLTIVTSLRSATRGVPYAVGLYGGGGTGSITWSVTNGALPPGLTFNNGAISGSPTANGTYAFTVQATDSGNPPQIVTAQESIQVLDPFTIITPSTWPDACFNQPYSFTVQASGGAPPITWGFSTSRWMSINLDSSTGVFSGTSTLNGTFTGTVNATDANGNGTSQQITLTVKTCP